MPETPKVHPSIVAAMRVAACDYFRCRDEGCQDMGGMCPKDENLKREFTALRPLMEAVAREVLAQATLERFEPQPDPAAIVSAVLARPVEGK